MNIDKINQKTVTVAKSENILVTHKICTNGLSNDFQETGQSRFKNLLHLFRVNKHLPVVSDQGWPGDERTGFLDMLLKRSL